MRRAFLWAGIAAVSALIAFRAPAQEPQVWVTTSIQYSAFCNCVDASFTTGDNETAAEYYDLNSSACLSDYDQTYSSCSNLSVANVPYGDYFYMDAWIGGPLDEEFSQCPTASCQFIACCTNNCFCSCLSCYGVPTEPYVSAESIAPTATGTCGVGPTVDTLENEYIDPMMFGMTQDTGPKMYIPPCNFTTSNLLSGYSGYTNARAFSGGDITSVAIFQPALIAGLSQINTTIPPQGMSGAPSLPLAPSPTSDVIYRTPLENWTQNSGDYHKNELHQDGGAIDFASNSGNWSSVAGWTEWATGSDPGGAVGTVCVEPENMSGNGHVHVDWRRVITGTPGCLGSWELNWMPGGWPSH